MFKNMKIVINICLLVMSIVHISLILKESLNPEIPSLQINHKNIEDIQFPIVFKVCVHEEFEENGMFRENNDKFNKFGYENKIKFDAGESMFNSGLFGWNGHSENGSSLGILTQEILMNVTIDWSNIIERISFYAGDVKIPDINGSELKWSTYDQYPSCQIIDLSSERRISNKPLDQIIIFFNWNLFSPDSLILERKKYCVEVFILDKQLKTRRFAKSLMMSYQGPKLSFTDPEETKLMLKLYQTLSAVSGDDGSCQNYPNHDYNSYEECDTDYAKKIFANYGLTPYWLSSDKSKNLISPR